MSGAEKNAAETVAELKTRAASEPVARLLKMDLAELTPGYSRVTMTVLPEHVNFNGLVFGGIIMSLADQAFAYASNSLSLPSLASQFNIYFLGGSKVNDVLTAECRVLKNGRRVGISEITITNQTGKLIARATGTTIPIRK